jgi:two-component system sensor histidine kinase/response regulator
MIVDDSVMNQLFLSSVAKLMGCNIFIAQNGREAVDKSMVLKYDLIFMDLEMPILKGDLATFMIRQKGNINSKTPIILQSSSIIEDKLFKDINGFTEEISKPYVLGEIKNVILKYTSQNKNTLSIN